MKKALSLTALIVLVTFLLAGCGSNDPSGSRTNASGHNQQDVTFATDMVPHHLQAVQMAKMAQTRASSPAVKTLANEIQAAQGPEIDTMSGWLKSWGEKFPDNSMGGMNTGGSNEMPGMMSDQVMTDLAAARGATFDTMWLRSMISHHQGAVQMADTEITDGKDPEAVALAKSIKAAQTTEIATMKKLLKP